MWEVFQKNRQFLWMKLHISRRERKLLVEALNMMQLHISVGKGMFRVIQRQKVYEHQGGKQARLDHDAELQPYIRKATAIFQIACTLDTSKCFREIIGFEKGGWEMEKRRRQAHCIRKSDTLPSPPALGLVSSWTLFCKNGASSSHREFSGCCSC